MTGSCTPALAGAVSNAGGLGSMGCAAKSIETIRREVTDLRAASNRGFDLNFFVTPAPETEPAVLEDARERLRPWYERYELGEPPRELPELAAGFTPEHLDLMMELRPTIVSFHFGHPGAEVIETLKSVGIKLLSSATNVREARELEAVGMDAIIAQG